MHRILTKLISEAYKTGTQIERDALTKKYGPYRIQKAIEEYLSMALIEDTSKQCPKCKSWMQVSLKLQLSLNAFEIMDFIFQNRNSMDATR